MFKNLKQFDPVALVVFGWLAFVLGLIVQPVGLKLVLLSAARVLP